MAALLVAMAMGCGGRTTAFHLEFLLDASLATRAPEGTFTLDPVGEGGKRLTIPARCENNTCVADAEADTGTYDVTFALELADRCGARAIVGTFTGRLTNDGPAHQGLLQLEPLDHGSIDDDDDGISNLAELAVCGRFDVQESDLRPLNCAQDNDPCCPPGEEPPADGSPRGDVRLQGQGALFVPPAGNFQGRPVEPFVLDATEVTWGTLLRCIASGRCVDFSTLSVDIQEKIATGSLDVDEPVFGVSAEQAMEVCAWLGKRLPTNDEWSFAAWHIDGNGEPGRYPFELNEDQVISCLEPTMGTSSVVAANHAASGEACKGRPLPVGSFPSSHVKRGEGSPIADLAGNVPEWTLISKDSTSPAPVRYEDVGSVALRGGGWWTATAVLANDTSFVADAQGDPNIERWATRAGFRCVAEADPVAPSLREEPACGEVP